MVRKASRLVALDDIVSSAFDDEELLISPVLRGHLVVEALLVELILTSEHDENSVWRWSFPKKTEFAADNALMPAQLKKALDLLNDFRNDIAHIFDHQVSAEQVHKLAKDLEHHGVEFSDSLGNRPFEDVVADYDGICGMLYELLWCLSFEVAQCLLSAGGRDLFSEE
ncbi:hypothetical protein D1227_04545 [Henriciella mobilis]|uniref:hypothetical protein n=1 Tax=Henriciella mobilis TaxID=2305467 RepID=UPI000E66592D|nr:hypothetical protein [Henriciella mobilis]RIJ25594.1 hypothetical protein D1227_04545 [Henriciella mobilis]